MKKIFYYICAGVMMLSAASCAKENVATPEAAGQMTIVASLDDEDATKATFNGDDATGYKTIWQEGDQIKIYCAKESKTYVYTLSEGAGTRVGRFTGDKLPSGDYIATYGGGFTYASAGSLSNEQSFISSSDASYIPLTAKVNYNSYYDETTITSFKNATGLLRLSLHGTGSIKKIKITTDQYISGAATIDNSDRSVVVNQSGSGIYKYVTLNCENSIDINFETKDFYITLPKGEYTGLKIEFTDDYGFVVTKTLNAGKKLNIYRAKINPIELTINFPAGKSKATINGQEVDVRWFQLYENGPKWAEYNIGVTDGKPESYGGKYSWGGFTNGDRNDHYSGDNEVPINHDTANHNWGSNWRTPHINDYRNLVSYTTNNVVTINSIQGKRFTGKGNYSVYSVFFPYCSDDTSEEDYWSRSTYSGYYKYSFHLRTDSSYFHWSYLACFPVRAICIE